MHTLYCCGGHTPVKDVLITIHYTAVVDITSAYIILLWWTLLLYLYIMFNASNGYFWNAVEPQSVFWTPLEQEVSPIDPIKRCPYLRGTNMHNPKKKLGTAQAVLIRGVPSLYSKWSL